MSLVKKGKTVKYYVTYLENGSPCLKVFEEKETRQKWIFDWLLKNHHQGCVGGFEIDLIFEGNIEWSYFNLD